MRPPIAAAVACTLLLACGDDPELAPACTVAVRGAVIEDLPCVVLALQAGAGDTAIWQVHLQGYAGARRTGLADVDVFLLGSGAPAAGVAYGFDGPGTEAVTEATAVRRVDVTSSAVRVTHDASLPGGALSLTVSAFPPPGSEGGAHGTVVATLPADGGGDAITIDARF